MYVQSCCFTDLNLLLFFCRSRYRRRSRRRRRRRRRCRCMSHDIIRKAYMKYRPICYIGWSDFFMFVDATHINFTLERNSFRLSGITFMQTATISSKKVWFRCADISLYPDLIKL